MLSSRCLLPGQLRATHQHLGWSKLMRDKLSGLAIALEQFCRQEFVWGHQGARGPRDGCGEGLKTWEGDTCLCLLKTRNSSWPCVYRRGAVGMQTLAALGTAEASCLVRGERSRNRTDQQENREREIEPGRQNDSEVPTLTP